MKNYLGASLGYILVQIYFYFISSRSDHMDLSSFEKIKILIFQFVSFSIFYFIFSFLINRSQKNKAHNEPKI